MSTHGQDRHEVRSSRLEDSQTQAQESISTADRQRSL